MSSPKPGSIIGSARYGLHRGFHVCNTTSRLREYKRLKEIEQEPAKVREKAGKKISRNPSANLREGRSDERAAKSVGLKPRTAEKGLAIVNKAESGDERAKQNLEKIDRNEISIDRAYRETRTDPTQDEDDIC
jgi:hypothetical protein